MAHSIVRGELERGLFLSWHSICRVAECKQQQEESMSLSIRVELSLLQRKKFVGSFIAEEGDERQKLEQAKSWP